MMEEKHEEKSDTNKRKKEDEPKSIDDPKYHHGMFCTNIECFNVWYDNITPVYNRDFVSPSKEGCGFKHDACIYKAWSGGDAGTNIKIDDQVYLLPDDHCIEYAFFRTRGEMVKYLDEIANEGRPFVVECLHKLGCDPDKCSVKWKPIDSINDCTKSYQNRFYSEPKTIVNYF